MSEYLWWALWWGLVTQQLLGGVDSTVFILSGRKCQSLLLALTFQANSRTHISHTGLGY